MGANNNQTDYVFGVNAVTELLRHNAGQVIEIRAVEQRRDKRMSQLLQLAEEYHTPVVHYSSDELDALVAGRHQGVVAAVKQQQLHDEQWLHACVDRLQEAGEQPFFLVLDGVTDPHNLGACIRSADAAGVHVVIVPKDNAAGLTAVVRKVASGAVETTPVVAVVNLARCIKQMKKAGIWFYAATGEAGGDLFETDLSGPVALVLGAEGSGVRRLTREHCDHEFVIPMEGSVESLNVSVATGVCLFEVLRQRRAR